MNEPTRDAIEAVAEEAQAPWHRFIQRYEPLRPDLYRYCRFLTRSPWDAEDLVQDTLGRAFVTLVQMRAAPANPKAWLFRVASNLWIDRARAAKSESAPRSVEVEAPSVGPQATREAAGTLIAALSPQERAAVVLKDVFDFELDEIATTLATTPGAVKSALFRGRGKLVEPSFAEVTRAKPAALDAFCDAFNARDVDRLTALLLDTSATEVVGMTVLYGAEAARHTVIPGMLFGSRRMAAAHTEGGIDPRFMQRVLPEPPRAELRQHRDEWIVLLWYAHEDGEAVRGINRVELEGDRVARLRNYFFTPECIAEVCGELGVPFRSNGRRSCASPASCTDRAAP